MNINLTAGGTVTADSIEIDQTLETILKN